MEWLAQMSFTPGKHKRQQTRQPSLWAVGQGFGQAWPQAQA